MTGIKEARGMTDELMEQRMAELNARNTEKTPAFSIPAGRLLQVLVGYTDLESQRPYVHIYDEAGFQEINEKLPKCNCYIIDEY